MTAQSKDLSALAAADYLCTCGKRHRTDIQEIHLDGPVIGPLRQLISRQTGREGLPLRPGHSRILMIADGHTWQAAGHAVHDALAGMPSAITDEQNRMSRTPDAPAQPQNSTPRTDVDSAGYPIDTCIFAGEPVLIPDEKAVFAVIRAMTPETALLVAIGSGTLNDLTRFISSRTGIPYYIVATAPSMDGYASSVAPMIINQMKVTVEACGAAAILGDPTVLSASPAIMLAAGLGDILGKYSAICDWRMGALVTDEYYCEDVARQVLETVESCRRQSRNLGRHDPAAAKSIMEGLILSGIYMSQVGNSRPASGAEHHLSHFWEMSLLRQGRPPVLHGSKVGLASIMICSLYRHLLTIQPDFTRAREHARARMSEEDHQTWVKQMRVAYQEGADELIELEKISGKNDPARMARRIDMLEEKWMLLCHVIEETIPDPETIRQALVEAGGVTDPEQLGIDRLMVADALRYAREMRNRYTVLQLYADLGLTDKSVELVLRQTFCLPGESLLI